MRAGMERATVGARRRSRARCRRGFDTLLAVAGDSLDECLDQAVPGEFARFHRDVPAQTSGRLRGDRAEAGQADLAADSLDGLAPARGHATGS